MSGAKLNGMNRETPYRPEIRQRRRAKENTFKTTTNQPLVVSDTTVLGSTLDSLSLPALRKIVRYQIQMLFPCPSNSLPKCLFLAPYALMQRNADLDISLANVWI